MDSDVEYRRFADRRRRINERLEQSAAQIDVWIADHEGRTASLSELASLEGLLQTRREQLAQMLEQDESFMNQLLRLRETAARSDSASAQLID